ncbi:FAD-dependent oxidoreductase [Paenibacillus naphthalenovorans]|uniref:FAD-dependent oxidoreductase n=1 Tax=Paenibacillus naphthalenovorans TaxID=162209 RepID=UPI003D27BA2C
MKEKLPWEQRRRLVVDKKLLIYRIWDPFFINSDNHLIYEADVLVLGGGPAGTWAAYTAASLGVKVVLVDKGYCGSSGATAPSGTSLWNVRSDLKKEKKI